MSPSSWWLLLQLGVGCNGRMVMSSARSGILIRKKMLGAEGRGSALPKSWSREKQVSTDGGGGRKRRDPTTKFR
ncbi:hypothetical protein F4809DRAFT_588568 [Biscogniauxia mediterranea]|nr:hypothetical protein F4809DRAFT_588568 [Biscogniauxia mediterranea]